MAGGTKSIRRGKSIHFFSANRKQLTRETANDDTDQSTFCGQPL